MKGRMCPMKIREALRMREMEFNNTQISQSINCSRTTLIELFKRCDENKITHQVAAVMKDSELDKSIFPEVFKLHRKEGPDFKKIHSELNTHPNTNLQLLWTEYKNSEPDGLSYSSFCARYSEWKNISGQNVSMHIERVAGEKMEVDWAGDRPELVIDYETGVLRKVHLFVAIVGTSKRVYAEAFPDEKLSNWIIANTHALEYYGAIPRIVVPDNTKTAVIKHTNYDSSINSTYLEWAEHYGIAVIPARVRKPKDKASVEGSVGWLETWVLARLRNSQFFNFNDLNIQIIKILNELNNQPYQKLDGCRLSVFKEADLPSMRPLPHLRFENPEFKKCTVDLTYHVEFKHFYYSVPYIHSKKLVTLRVTDTVVEVLYNNERITSHKRNYDTRKRYQTNPEHMPANHIKQLENSQWDGKRFRSWAAKIGLNTYSVADAILVSVQIEEQGYSACMGLLQLARKYSNERLEKACNKAKLLSSSNYRTVSNILKNGQENTAEINSTSKSIPEHSNIRNNYK